MYYNLEYLSGIEQYQASDNYLCTHYRDIVLSREMLEVSCFIFNNILIYQKYVPEVKM